MSKPKPAAPIEEADTLAHAVLVESCAFTMEKWFLMNKCLGLTKAGSKEEFYGFRAADIADVHCRLVGICEVLFFRIRDGRVFDCMAREHDPDPMLYDQTIH